MTSNLTDRQSSTGSQIMVSGTASVTQNVVRAQGRVSSEPKNEDHIEQAVFSYIQAMRALGNNQIETKNIADALGLSVRSVHSVIGRLRDRGVRIG